MPRATFITVTFRIQITRLCCKICRLNVERVKNSLNLRGRFSSSLLAGILIFGIAGCSNNPYPEEITNRKIQVLGGGTTVSFDPTVCYNTVDSVVVTLVFPTFYRFKPFKQDPYDVELNLGASPPVVVEKKVTLPDGSRVNGEEWTFHFRHGVKFHDDECFPGGKGREVNANDIVYSIKRLADPTNHCPIASYVTDKIVGLQAYSDGFAKLKDAQYKNSIPGVEVDPHDKYTLKITLSEPYPQLKYMMAMAFFTPQAHEALEHYGKDEIRLHHLVGCGPYCLAEFKAHQSIFLKKNPNAPKELYPSEADPQFKDLLGYAGQQVPLTDGIYFPFLSESITAYNLFQQGYLDQLGISSGNAHDIPTTNGLTPEMKARGITLRASTDVSFEYMCFNLKDSVVGGYDEKHKKLRQAISLSIDSKAYIDLIGQGLGKQAEFMIPPGLEGFDEDYKNPYRRYDPSLTKAKQLLAEAGYPNGIGPDGNRLILTYDCVATTPTARQKVRLFAQQIEKLGIKVDIRSTSYNEFDTKLKAGRAQFIDYGWFADYPDPENFLQLLYSKAAPDPNYVQYNNPQYDALFEKARAMRAGPERLALIKQMRDIAVEDCGMIYTDYTEVRRLVQPWVKNSFYHPIAYDGKKFINFDLEMRKQKQAEWNHPNLLPSVFLILLAVGIAVPTRNTFQARMNRRVRKTSIPVEDENS